MFSSFLHHLKMQESFNFPLHCVEGHPHSKGQFKIQIKPKWKSNVINHNESLRESSFKLNCISVPFCGTSDTKTKWQKGINQTFVQGHCS